MGTGNFIVRRLFRTVCLSPIGFGSVCLLLCDRIASPAFADEVPPPRPLHEEIDQSIRRLKERRAGDMRAAFARARRFEPRLSSLLRKSGVPISLLGLGFVESEFRPHATGVGTAGVWQFQERTARRFGLAVSKRTDGRREVIASTECLLRYLHFLHDKFQDWLLVIVAFKIGEGNLERALKKNGVRTLMGLFGNGGLTKQTRRYVFDVLAHGLLYQEYLEGGV